MVGDLQSEESDEDDSSSGEEAAGMERGTRGGTRVPGQWGGVGVRSTGVRKRGAHWGALPGH